MFKNFIRTATFSLLAVGVISCGGSAGNDSLSQSGSSQNAGDNELRKGNVFLESTKINGKLSEYFKLVDKQCMYKCGIIDDCIVELECVKPLPLDTKGYVGVQVMDKDGVILSSRTPDATSFSDFELLSQMQPGDVVAINIRNYDDVDEEKNPTTIRVNSIIEDAKIAKIQQNFNAAQFEAGKSTLTPQAKRVLDELAEVMLANPDLKIKVVGHTSPEGDAAANQKLSEERAESTVIYLVEKGVNSDNLSYEGKGSSQLIDLDNPEPNRRTEFIIED